MHIFEVHPKRPISGILPNQRRIESVMKLQLSEKEFLRCMNYGTVYAVVGEERVLVTSLDYNKALELFDKHVEYTNKTVNLSENFDQDQKIDWKTNTLVKPEPNGTKEEQEEGPNENKQPVQTHTNNRNRSSGRHK